MKGKPLLPVLRTKKRYVVYECLSEQPIGHKDIYQSLVDSYKQHFGLFGLSQAGIMDTRLSEKNRGIIKVNNKSIDNMRAAMAMTSQIRDSSAIVKTVGVSGILKKSKKYLEG